MKPLVGITCCSKPFGLYFTPNHAASDTYVKAVDEVVGAVPVLLPANGPAADVETLLGRLDGIILTGSRSNVQPQHYDGPSHAEGTPEDEMRDAVTLRLIRGAIASGTPLLGICRGLQEMNVALGGSLHQRLQDLPGRIDHATPMHGSDRIRTAKAHRVTLSPDGTLARIAGDTTVRVNSLHNQGIDRLAPGLAVEGTAPDGTIEAVRVDPAAGFALGVQWHPEYDFRHDAVSRGIFVAFRDALRATQRAVARAAE